MGSFRVLVVDDDPKIRTSLVRALRDHRLGPLPGDPDEHGLELVEADSGERGLEVIAEARPDLVFLDLMLPGMSGLDVLDRLREGDHDLLTVLITAFASIDTAVAATKRGAFDVLAKPFAPEDARAVLQKGAEHLLARRRAAKLARERGKVRYLFVSELAHELNAPLQVIQGYLELLRERTLGEELEAYDRSIDKMLERALMMRKIISDLHHLTRLEAGEKSRTFEQVDLEEAALLAIETVEPEASARRIAVRLHQTGDPLVEADRTDVESVLCNLLTNAVKYNRDGGRVDLHIDCDAPVVTIRVVDTGIGIAAEDLDRLFDEFYRVRAPETEGVSGTGLGLSIVRRIASAYGGRVGAESEPGEGTAFTVTLERRPEAS